MCNLCRGADVYWQENMARLKCSLSDTGTQDSCHIHPLHLFSWKTVGLDTFERIGFVIELGSQLLSNFHVDMLETFKELLLQ